MSRVCYLCRRTRADKWMDGHRCADKDDCLRVAGKRLPAQHAKIAKKRPRPV